MVVFGITLRSVWLGLDSAAEKTPPPKVVVVMVLYFGLMLVILGDYRIVLLVFDCVWLWFWLVWSSAESPTSGLVPELESFDGVVFVFTFRMF